MINSQRSRLAQGIWLAMAGILAISVPLASNADTAIGQMAAKVLPYQAKPRVFVLTDIGNEPDDQMSLTRFLLYANEMNVEGLVATTSTWQREKVHTDMIELVLGHYGEVQPNLLKHAAGFPTQSQLAAVVAPGVAGYGLAATGPGKHTAGSDLLVKAIEKSTDAGQPLYINLWGGRKYPGAGIERHKREASGEHGERVNAKPGGVRDFRSRRFRVLGTRELSTYHLDWRSFQPERRRLRPRHLDWHQRRSLLPQRAWRGFHHRFSALAG